MKGELRHSCLLTEDGCFKGAVIFLDRPPPPHSTQSELSCSITSIISYKTLRKTVIFTDPLLVSSAGGLVVQFLPRCISSNIKHQNTQSKFDFLRLLVRDHTAEQGCTTVASQSGVYPGLKMDGWLTGWMERWEFSCVFNTILAWIPC